jgi:hypothetical protein
MIETGEKIDTNFTLEIVEGGEQFWGSLKKLIRKLMLKS